MAAPLTFSYDRSGVPVELAGESDWRRAVLRGHIDRRTLVTVFGADAGPKMLPAGQVPELQRIFDEVDPRSDAPPRPGRTVAKAPARDEPVDEPIFPETDVDRFVPEPPFDPVPPLRALDDRPSGEAAATGSGWSAPLALVGVLMMLMLVIGLVRGCGSKEPTPSVPQAAPEADPVVLPAPVPAAPTTYPTSYDCGRAAGLAERLVCGDPDLARRDRELAALYATSLQRTTGANRRELRQGQRAWIARRDGCAGQGDVDACLRRAYSDRLSALTTAPAREVEGTRPAARAARSADETLIRAPAPEAILCVLPDGSEARIPLQQCRLRSGVVMN